MATITPKGWAQFQHYKDRKPTWIKLHRDLLDNYEYHLLPTASRALAPCLWLLASEYDHGAIPADWCLVAFRLRMTAKDVESAVTPLIDSGFFIASSPLAGCKQSACLETETYKAETETEKHLSAAEAPAKKTSAAKGERLSVDWSLPDDWKSDAIAAGVPVGAVDLEGSKFRDYWVAKTGKDATKHDWQATWRNWCRNAVARTYRPTQGKPSKHDLSQMDYSKGVTSDGKF